MLKKYQENNNNIKYVVIGNKVEEIKSFVVHKFKVSDVEDPDLYAAEPLYEWEKSEKGEWIMKNAYETPEWHRHLNHLSYSYEYLIRAKFKGPTITEYLLRYHN